MANVFVDASLFAVPPADAGRARLATYIRSLVRWSRLRRESWLRVCTSERSSRLFSASRHFPIRCRLDESMTANGFVAADVETICRCSGEVLGWPKFEEIVGVSDVLWTEGSLCLDPETFLANVPRDLVDESKRTVCMLALARACAPPSVGLWCFVAAVGVAGRQPVNVRAGLDLADMTGDWAGSDISFPYNLQSWVPVCDALDDPEQVLDPADCWGDGSDSGAVRTAVLLAGVQLSRELGRNASIASLPRLDVHREFCTSLCPDGFDTERPKIERLLRTAASVLVGHDRDKDEPLRKSRGGNAPARMRGSDEARRCDIDYEYHLHYWKLAGGGYELAHLAHHNDFSIPL